MTENDRQEERPAPVWMEDGRIYLERSEAESVRTAAGGLFDLLAEHVDVALVSQPDDVVSIPSGHRAVLARWYIERVDRLIGSGIFLGPLPPEDQARLDGYHACLGALAPPLDLSDASGGSPG